ncbi:MAG: ABC transporter ATP-binding protein [Candidatus Omnitrophica bacterium]|nr:ABC transporter ATP-binding protein [Candidatus Omnitrophota bacterium]
MEQILEVKNLSVLRVEKTESISILNDINFMVKKGEMFCLVGESGSGKTTLALSIIKLLPKSFKIASGEILINGKNILEINEQSMRNIRGKDISIIFQDPSAYLDPLFTIGSHLQESYHGKNENKKELISLALQEVGLDSEVQTVYPHQLSGGQQQRVMIAMALINKPSIIIADEPTTALDVLTTRQVIDLLNAIRLKHNPAIFFITHDLELAMKTGTRIGIMYRGHIVEIFKPGREKPSHPYANILLGTIEGKDTILELNFKKNTMDSKQMQQKCPFFDMCVEKEARCKKTIPFVWCDSETGIRCLKNGRNTQV